MLTRVRMRVRSALEGSSPFEHQPFERRQAVAAGW